MAVPYVHVCTEYMYMMMYSTVCTHIAQTAQIECNYEYKLDLRRFLKT